MLNKICLLFIIFFLLPLVHAQGYAQNNYATIDVNLNASLTMDYKTTNARLENLNAELQFFPRASQTQEIIFLNTNSEPYTSIRKTNNIEYKWDSNNELFNYGFNSRVKVKNSIIKIDNKLPFPITGLKEEDLKFTQATEFIDITSEIKNKANEIVEGEDDFFNAIVKLAEWTRININYNLNTLTEGAVQKSSWVLATKEGVCDEITNLFVSFLRSLNIPVKYVSGMAYSSAIDGFGPHAWAEVYFPKYGWIPFDITFGQYGWIDPSHVKMVEGLGPKEPSVIYSWRAINVGISDKRFNITADLVNTGESINPLVKLEIIPIKNNIAGGSFLPLEVKITNLQDFYLSTMVFFTIAPEIINKNEKVILLKPKQEKSLYWILKLDEIQDQNKYIAMIEAQDTFGAKAATNLNFAKTGEFLTLEETSKLIKELEKIEEKRYKYDLNIDCSSDKTNYYKHETATINCNLKNIGNTPLNFDLCFDNSCKETNLKISEEKIIVLNLTLENNKTLKIGAKGKNIELSHLLNMEVFSEPKVEISDLKYNNLRYDQEGNYEFILSANPEVSDLKVKITGSKILRRDKFFGKQRFSLPFKAWKIGSGQQKIDVTISYKDKNEKTYTLEKNYKIEIENIKIWDKILINLKDLMNLV